MSHGYPAERHQVTTEDGYILKMHRIPGKRGETPTSSTGRPVVFLMHGLSSASSAFIGLGPEWSIGKKDNISYINLVPNYGFHLCYGN